MNLCRFGEPLTPPPCRWESCRCTCWPLTHILQSSPARAQAVSTGSALEKRPRLCFQACPGHAHRLRSLKNGVARPRLWHARPRRQTGPAFGAEAPRSRVSLRCGALRRRLRSRWPSGGRCARAALCGETRKRCGADGLKSSFYFLAFLGGKMRARCARAGL